MESTREQHLRADFFVGMLVLLFLTLGARLWSLQHDRHEEFLEAQQRQALTVIPLAPQRGTVRDTHGKPLAISVPIESVWADPRQIEDKAGAAALLAQAVDEEPAILLERLSSEKHEVLIGRKVAPEQAEAVRKLALNGVSFRREFKRVYPEGTLGCHFLGFVNIDEIGCEGLELALSAELAGKPGKRTVSRDALQNRIETEDPDAVPATPGLDVTLTIDTTLQYFVEKALDQVMKDWDPVSTSGVLLDVRTGDILALASRPGFDPNRYGEATPAARRNRAITDPMEPGSTFKPFVVSAVLEFGLHSPTDLIDCENGCWVEGKRTIRDHAHYGMLTVQDVIAKSSNIGIGKLGLELGKERMRPWLSALQFGEPTECGLPGESNGVLHPLSRWGRDSVKSVSMGYEVEATPLQLAAAYAALANRGMPMKPRLIRRIEDPETGKPVREPAPRPALAEPLMTESAWRDLMDMLREVVDTGTGKKAKVPGYHVGGKTGTANKAVNGHYTSAKVATFFAAVAPTSDPRVVLVIVVDEPRGAPFAGTVAAPVAGQILVDALRYLQIPPDDR